MSAMHSSLQFTCRSIYSFQLGLWTFCPSDTLSLDVLSLSVDVLAPAIFVDAMQSLVDIFLSRVSTMTHDIDIENLCLSVCLSVTFRYCMKTA